MGVLIVKTRKFWVLPREDELGRGRSALEDEVSIIFKTIVLDPQRLD